MPTRFLTDILMLKRFTEKVTEHLRRQSLKIKLEFYFVFIMIIINAKSQPHSL